VTAREGNLIKEKNNGIEEESDRKAAPQGQDNSTEEAALQSNRRLQIRGVI
jgi:hypothetical protein